MFSSPVLLRLGCKVDVFDLKVEAVNTHRDRPLVSFCFCFVFRFYCLISIKKKKKNVLMDHRKPDRDGGADLPVMGANFDLSNQNKHRCSGHSEPAAHDKYTTETMRRTCLYVICPTSSPSKLPHMHNGFLFVCL